MRPLRSSICGEVLTSHDPALMMSFSSDTLTSTYSWLMLYCGLNFIISLELLMNWSERVQLMENGEVPLYFVVCEMLFKTHSVKCSNCIQWNENLMKKKRS